MRTQAVIFGLLVAALVAVAFLGSRGHEAATAPTVASTTSSTKTPGYPPAAEHSVCRLVTRSDAELIAGQPVPLEPIEPAQAQCAWPVEKGTPLDASLFFIVKQREGVDLMATLRQNWDPSKYRFEAVEGLGDQAAFVIAPADDQGPAFVEGLEVYDGELHLIFGNGGNRSAWEGSQAEVRQHLREAMQHVLTRAHERLASTSSSTAPAS